MYTQTLYEAGNSLVITIPKEIVRKQNLKPGTRVTVTPSADNRLTIEIPLAKPVKKAASEKEFQTWLAKTLEEDSEILDELAKH